MNDILISVELGAFTPLRPDNQTRFLMLEYSKFQVREGALDALPGASPHFYG